MNTGTPTPTKAPRRARRAPLALLVSAGFALGGGTAGAQTATSAVLRGGAVSGLELSLEGSQRAPRGGTMRWLLSVHEVVGLSDLRPAGRVRVRVLSSLLRERPVVELTADAQGRLAAEYVVPADAPDRFRMVFEALSPRGVRRQFELPVAATPALSLSLYPDRVNTPAGEPLVVNGRLRSAVDGRAARTPVRLSLNDAHGRLAAPEVTLEPDEAGSFRHAFTLPAGAELASYTAHARTVQELPAAATTRITLFEETQLPLVVHASPSQGLARPGERVAVDVVVRTGDGRAVRNAAVRSPLLPTPPGQTEPATLRTDARGRARFEFDVTNASAPFVDLPIEVSASRAGVGTASTTTRVRVARADYFAALAAEGGALVPGLPGRVFVRVVRADGAPAPAGVPVTLEGPRVPSGVAGVTDENGVAALELQLTNPAARPARAPARRPARPSANDEADENEDSDEAASASDDPCGGATATELRAAVGPAGARQGRAQGCLAVDPDATVRVRLASNPLASAGAPLRVTLARSPAVRTWGVELAVVALRGAEQQHEPLTSTLVAPGATEATVALPAELQGPFVVRARPLQPGTFVPVRGGVAAGIVLGAPRVALVGELGAGPSPSLALRADGDANALAGLRARVTVLPAMEGERLYRARADEAPLAWLGDLRVEAPALGASLLAGTLAARLRPDEAAPAVLRGGRVTPQPAPEAPTAYGILRDPFRARGRFVEGRLARFFRAIETHVAENVREHRDDVAVRGPGGRWVFNQEIFDALASTGESEGAAPRALGGGPLSIEVLQRLDPAFTYDNVARRITRKRMFSVLLALRTFVNEHALDLRWSWRGDPSVWLRTLVRDDVSYNEEGDSVDEDLLRDGWGTPLALRPAPGGRARFSQLAPVPGYELVSAGPDERFGTADDVLNPFARVLPSGGAYARAVDEDGLLARLNGVELGRATIGSLAEVFEAEGQEVSFERGERGDSALADWNALPARRYDDPHALDVVRSGLRVRAVSLDAGSLAEGSARVAPALDDEPRTYVAVLEAYGPAGQGAVSHLRFSAGQPVLAALPLANTLAPDGVVRVQRGRPLAMPLTVTNLADEPRTYRLELAGDGLAVTGPAELRVAPGESASVELTLQATRVGPTSLRVLVRDAAGALLRELRSSVVADDGGLALRDDAAALALSTDRLERVLEVDLRRASSVQRARLVVAPAAALVDDPEAARLRRTDPALAAWSYTLAARALPSELAAALYAAQQHEGLVRATLLRDRHRGGGAVSGASTALSTACALATWSAAAEDDARASDARARAAQALLGLRGTMADGDRTAGMLREAAAVLAALGGGSAGADDRSGDPVAAHLEQLRAELRGSDGAHGAHPTLLARAAAALLVADPADERAVELFERARRGLRPDRNGFAWLAATGDRAGAEEELAANAALAVAAQQRGETALAQALGRSLAGRAHTALRLGGEPAFWLLASVSYGVFGLAAPTEVLLEGDGGAPARVALGAGAPALVPLELAAGGVRRVRVRARGAAGESAAVFARLEVLREAPYANEAAGPVALELQGDPGYTGERAALELTVRAGEERPARRVVLELQMPAGVLLDAAARHALLARPEVRSVELRDGGLARVVLHEVPGGATVTLPLNVLWTARGAVDGFGAVAYAEGSPAQRTVLAARTLALAPRPDDEAVAH